MNLSHPPILLSMMACRAMALRGSGIDKPRAALRARKVFKAKSKSTNLFRTFKRGEASAQRFSWQSKGVLPYTNGWENDKAVRPVNERKTRQSGFGTLSMPKAVKAMTVFTAFEMSDYQTTLYPASCTALASTASSTGAFRVTFTVPAVWLATAESTWGMASNACFT